MKRRKRIAVLTGGGDCPGLNAVIRAVAKKAMLDYDMEVIGVEDGYLGLIENRCRELSYQDVSGILTLGGTILGTSNTANPYRHAVREGGKLSLKDVSKPAIRNLKKLGVVCLVCIGGDGTLAIAHRLQEDGVNVVGVPKTIDNDLRGTDVTFGFDSAVTVATEGIDRVHTTAQSHHRVMIVEVMGRTAGWLALHAGVAGGGDIILLPEIPYDLDVIAARVKDRAHKGKRFSIVVVSEGAKPQGGKVVIQRMVEESTIAVRLGGISFALGEQIEQATGLTARPVVLGHLQRGGSPTAFDRVLATRLGAKAMDLAHEGDFGHMVGVRGSRLVKVPLTKVAQGPRNVPKDEPLIAVARSVGTSFGD
ncbi:MAG: 6-phosphofructokinase [Sedimentisphaerales bacterium]|nr:6-phosphofructokinase [Sedimentisphaerales bacterium]